MYCPKCGAQIPDDSAFCSSCGAPVSGGSPVEKKTAPVKTGPSMFENLLKTIKAFFSTKPDEGVYVAGESRTFEWAILIGANILFFAFAYAINIRQILDSALGILSGAAVHFGFFLLFGFLISILANGIVFGAYLLLEKVIHRGDQSLMSILNTVAYSTIPFTLVCALNMLLGLVWGLLVIPFVLIAALAQVYLLHTALKKHAKSGRVSFLAFIGISLAALFLTFLFGYLFFKAGVSASVSVAISSLY